MSNLEDTLKRVLDISWGGALDITNSKDFRNASGELDEDTYIKVKARIFDEAVNQIIQAFKEEGWSEPTPRSGMAVKILEESKFPPAGIKTGPEWYAAFEADIADVVITSERCRLAARRASGMEEKK